MKISEKMTNLLTNKMVLNIVAILALFNVIGYIIMGNIQSVLYFIVIGVLVGYFSRNMTIILGVPLIIVNLFALKRPMMEGMETATTPDSDSDSDTAIAPTTAPAFATKTESDKKSSQNLIMASVASGQEAPDNAAQTTGGVQQGFEAGRRKNRGNEIDYASTIEDAYDELNTVLGGEGIKRLTDDTQNLMKQQMQLADAMKGMGPVIQNLGPMMKQLTGMMGQMDAGKGDLKSMMEGLKSKK